ncbi:uncharacterized protein LOC123317537 [Coccinella septempunctata]|uniref:uncharacterized protein LOC123317537 n=1 Tax=Coccinella septempunctata TaxID=41139 RepID=UPI001D072675|nr:uncharacterized protein LOC123317537 [Coccinella septempunctata]
MCSALKILVCVALVFTSTVTSNERKKRSGFLNLGPAQYQPNWALRSNANERIVPLYDVLRVNLNEAENLASPVGNVAESTGEQTSILNYANPSYQQEEDSNRQYSTERSIQNEQGENVYSGLNEYRPVNGQRQPKFSNLIRNGQVYLVSNEPDQRLNSPSYGTINKGLQNPQRSGALNSQNSALLGENPSTNVAQDLSTKIGILGARNPLSSAQIGQLHNGYSSQLLRTDGLRQIPGSYAQGEAISGNLEGRRYQINRLPLSSNQLPLREQPIARNIQKNGLTSSRNNVGDGESWLRAVQGGNNGQRAVEAGSNPWRRPAIRNEQSSNVQSSQQGDGNGDNLSQGQNAYGYSELSAKILNVIRSNPSMMSNLGQLLGKQDSGNQQVRQLKQLLQEVGKINGNTAINGRGNDQSSLLKNLFDIMVQNGISPVSYHGVQRWRF